MVAWSRGAILSLLSSNSLAYRFSQNTCKPNYCWKEEIVWLTGFLRIPTGSRNLCWVISALSIISLVGFLIISNTNPSAAFYLMPTRFWELGAGCLLCLFLTRFDKRYILFFSKNESIVYATFVTTLLFAPKTFSTTATVLIVISTLLLIATSKPGTYIYGILNSRIAQYIGKISYSLYLWHWSVLCLSRWLVGTHLLLAPLLLLLMLLLASFSYHFVERPLRLANWSNTSGKSIFFGLTFGSGLAGVLLLLGSQHNIVLRKHQNYIEEPAAFFPLKNAGLPYNPTCVVDGQKRHLTSETFDNCTVSPKREGGQTIWALGDSHAGHLQGLLYSVHDKTGLGIHLIETPGITFPLNISEFEPRKIIFNEIMNRAKRGDIILIARIFIDRTTLRPLSDLSTWSQNVTQLARQLEEKGLKLVVFGPPPIFQYEHIDSCYFTILGFSPCVVERFSISSSVNQVLDLLHATLREQGNTYVFNSFKQLCPESNSICSPIVGNKFSFRDKDHLNTYGSTILTTPFIDFLQGNGLLIAS